MLLRRTAPLAVVLVVAGCGSTGMIATPPLDQAGFDARAAVVIDRWQGTPVARVWRTGFVPLEDLTRPPANGFPTEQLKLAFGDGWYRLGGTVPDDPPPTGSVRFADGSTLAVPLASARDAYQAMHRSDPPCERATPSGASPPADPLCAHLTVTGVRLATAPLRTSRGTATVPAWRFTVAELPEPVWRVAVAPSAVTALPEPAGLADSGVAGLLGTERVTGDTAGRTLTAHLGVGACDEDVRALVHETGEAVVVGGTARITDGPCTDELLIVPTPVELTQPVGQRVVLDAQSGRPLVVSP